MIRHQLDPEQRKVLARAVELARKRGLAGRVERKRSGLTLHTRGMKPGEANLLECVILAEWRRLCEGTGLSCLRMDGGVELRSELHSKRTALAAILAGHRKPDWVVFVGNDRYDEDAMAALPEGHYPMAVGVKIDDDKITQRFLGPDGLGDFLTKYVANEALPLLPKPKKSAKPAAKAPAAGKTATQSAAKKKPAPAGAGKAAMRKPAAKAAAKKTATVKKGAAKKPESKPRPKKVKKSAAKSRGKVKPKRLRKAAAKAKRKPTRKAIRKRTRRPARRK
jgi:hypothetical protein